MLKKIVSISLLSTALVMPAVADTDVVVDDFESYTSTAQLLAAWPSSNPARPDNATLLVPGDTAPFYGGTNLSNFAQFCGSANDATGIANCDSAGSSGVAGGGTDNIWNGAFQIAPSATQNVELSVDIGDDALSSNKRLTVGLRSTAPANIIEMGFYNVFQPTPHFSYRAILFQSGDITLDPTNAGWGNFSEDSIDQPLPPELDTPGEVGAGFHRFKAVIGVNQITFSLDLYADGKQNDPLNPVPGEGIDGVDAFDIVPAVTGPAGFNQIRFGTPSAISSSGGTNIDAAFAAFDNVSLRLVDIETPTGDADFNGDGKVDGRDFLIWQRGFGTPGALPADGDANGDMAVDSLDLGVWQSQYGSGSLTAITAVPEPCGAVLLSTALLSLIMKRRSLT